MMLFPRVLYYDIDKVQQKSQHVESFKLDCGFYKFHPFIFQILTYGGECLSFYFILDLFFLLTRGWINATWVKNVRNASWALSSVQSLHHVWLFVTLWTAALQASLSIPNSWSLLKLMSIELVMPSNLCHSLSSCLQSFPASGSFPMSWFFASGGQSIEVSALASVLQLIFRTDFF